MSPIMPTTAASSDPPVVIDLEEGAAAAAAGEKEMAATNKLKNPRVAFCAMVLVDAAAVFQVLLSIGLLTWFVSVAKYWWEPCLFVLYYFPFLVITLSIKPKTNYAMVLKPSTPESDDSNLSAKLVPE